MYSFFLAHDGIFADEKNQTVNAEQISYALDLIMLLNNFR